MLLQLQGDLQTRRVMDSACAEKGRRGDERCDVAVYHALLSAVLLCLWAAGNATITPRATRKRTGAIDTTVNEDDKRKKKRNAICEGCDAEGRAGRGRAGHQRGVGCGCPRIAIGLQAC